MWRRVVVTACNVASCCSDGLQGGVVLLSGTAMGSVVVTACNVASCCSEGLQGVFLL